MKKKRSSVKQIVGALQQAQMGVPVAEVIRKAGTDVLPVEGEVCGPGDK